jgi:hypothetical protein
MKNYLTFWMELNTPMKILAFCISSFQSSWHLHFTFHHSKVVSILHFAFNGELNTAYVSRYSVYLSAYIAKAI